jgi:hypothetical protein
MDKRLMWVMLVLSSIASMWAAEPFKGTWKLNVAKSKFIAGREVKELTMNSARTGRRHCGDVQGNEWRG